MGESSIPTDVKNLFDVELDFRDVQLALRVVNKDHSFRSFLRRVDVLLVRGPHGTLSLVYAAPSADLRLLMLLLIHLKGDRLLPDHQHLLVLHRVAVVARVQSRLDEVLALGLGTLAPSRIFEVHARRHLRREVESELHLVSARLQPTTICALDLEDWNFDVGKLVFVFNSLGSLHEIIPTPLLIVAGERGLFLTFNLHFDVGRGQRLENLNIHFALDSVARLVEGKFGLDLDAPLGKVASRVRKVEHLSRLHRFSVHTKK